MSEQPGKPPADTSWLQTTRLEPPPAIIRAALARFIDRIDGDDLFLLFLVLAMCGAAVCAPIAAIIWGAK